MSRPCFHRTSSVRWSESPLGLRLSTNKENRVSSCSTLPEASERYQVLSHSRLSMMSERWENNFEGSKPQSFPVSRSRHQIKKYARDHYVAGQYFFNGAPYFFLFTRRRPFTQPRPESLEPRPKFACRSKISQNQIFIFVASLYYNLSGFRLSPPPIRTKKRRGLPATPNEIMIL